MPFSDAAANAAVDGLTGVISHLSAHTAWSATGLNEVAGGSYARQAVGWDAATGRIADNTAQESIPIPAGTTVGFIGCWSALTAGTFRGMVPVESSVTAVGVGYDGDDYVYADGHGFSDTDTVVCFEGNDGLGVCGGLTIGTIYYVRDSVTDRFKLAATSGGVAINLTDTKLMIVQGITETTFAVAGNLIINAGDLDIIALGGSVTT